MCMCVYVPACVCLWCASLQNFDKYNGQIWSFSYNLGIEVLHCIQDFLRTKFGICFFSEKKNGGTSLSRNKLICISQKMEYTFNILNEYFITSKLQSCPHQSFVTGKHTKYYSTSTPEYVK